MKNVYIYGKNRDEMLSDERKDEIKKKSGNLIISMFGITSMMVLFIALS